MYKLLISILVISLFGTSIEALAEQKILFCGETSSYRGSYAPMHDYYSKICSKVCSQDYSCSLDKVLADGWKIDTNMAKSIFSDPPKGIGYDGQCSCNGTEYVMSKVEKKVEVAPQNDKVAELYKKEIELLKKENDMLRKENEGLKNENDVLKTKVKKKK